MARSSAIVRASLALVGLLALTLGAACGGFSEDEAAARCDQEQEARGAEGCFTDATYAECLAAHEECGEDVEIAESCPVQYVCPE
jgi:hypothetical protein